MDSLCGCCPNCRRRDRTSSTRSGGSDDVGLLTGDYSQHGGNNWLPVKDYESLDYDICHNAPYQEMVENDNTWMSRHLGLMRWVVTALIGVGTGLVAVFIDVFVKYLSDLKYSTVSDSILVCKKDGCLVLSLLILLGFGAGFVLIASILVAIEPIAAGSGIPEIKCYLNGIKVPHVVRLKTLLSKAIGVLFSVSGGLFVGKEGPMIHSGAIVGAGIPQFQSITFRKLNFNFPYFRTDRDKRDFVSGGAAAGVAAAFGAPIGGVLFSLEEGSSFWNQMLTWRTFFCAMCATFTLNFLLSGLDYQQWGALDQPGLIDFGIFDRCEKGKTTNCDPWTALDLLVFIVMGFVGGLLGALFNFLNTKLTIYRMKHLGSRRKFVRVLEAILIVMVTASIAFGAAMTLGQCKKLPSSNAQEADNRFVPWSSNVSSGNGTEVTFFCQDGYYNDMATLFFNSQEIAIKELFHEAGKFSLQSLGIFFGLFFLLACWTYGAMVPSGLFVPCLLCGAAYGRIVGNILNEYTGFANISNIYSGTFALIGAASFLGGVVRMTISLTVILIESTNEISYGLPIMVTLMVAKWSGDLFNKGLYDIHVELKGLPLLGWEPPRKMDRLRAHQIMETRLTYIYPHTRVRSLISILRTTQHHAYPVVTENLHTSAAAAAAPPNSADTAVASKNILYKRESTLSRSDEQRQRSSSVRSVEMLRVHRMSRLAADYNLARNRHDSAENTEDWDRVSLRTDPSGYPSWLADVMSLDDNEDTRDDCRPLTFHGVILRSHLVMLLKKKVCYAENTSSLCQEELSYGELTEDYPRFQDIHDIDINAINHNKIMDVTSFMNPCPYTVSPETPVSKVFNLFRTMGLRHLMVINSCGEVLGIITRHNLTEEFLEEKLEFYGDAPHHCRNSDADSTATPSH
ncbi:chloride transport protein 6-like [Patiria miniata]|uniref:Chloride channel protein n=1 Tax=Patiria miniata TaxID=46514 RepID=A0A914ACL1_PATMI|nr:chloride transport protein 6-like [Patiria miniata]